MGAGDGMHSNHLWRVPPSASKVPCSGLHSSQGTHSKYFVNSDITRKKKAQGFGFFPPSRVYSEEDAAAYLHKQVPNDS